MALDDVKQSVISNITNAYEKALDKGATEPTSKNLENLAATIDSIQGGTILGYHVRSVVNKDGKTQTLKIITGAGGGDLIDVEQLPTENVEDNKIYRIAQPQGSYYWQWLQDEPLALAGTYTEIFVDGVENITDPQISTGFGGEGVIIIYTDVNTYTGYVYIDSLDNRVTLAEAFGFEDTSYNKGAVNSVNDITSPGIYYVVASGTIIGVPTSETNKTVMEYKSGEWKTYSRLTRASLVGLWYDAELNEYLELHDDGTAVVKDGTGAITSSGTFEPGYAADTGEVVNIIIDGYYIPGRYTVDDTGVKIENYVKQSDVVLPSTLLTKEITENGTYNASDDGADGYSSVTVNVVSSGDLVMDDRTVYKLDFSEGDVELTPKYTVGGLISIADDTKILEATRFAKSGNSFVSSGSGGHPARCSLKFEFICPTDGSVKITADRLSASQESGKCYLAFSKIDTDMGGGDPRGHENCDFYFSTYTDVYTYTINNVPAGKHTLHVVVYGPEGFYSNFQLTNLIVPEKISNADVLRKVNLIKPEELSPANIVGGIKLFGIEGTALAASDLLEGTATNITDTKITKLKLSFVNNSTIKAVDLPKVVDMPSSAFQSCSNLSFVNLGGCKTIGQYAFKGCTKLTSAVFGESLSSIGAYAFSDAKLSGEVVLPGLKSLGTGVFAYNNITRFDASNFSDFLYSSMFVQCSLMSQVNMPGVSRIYPGAFNQCYVLESANFPNCTLLSGSQTFANCSELSVINMPKCTSVGQNAFLACKKLSSVIMPELSMASANAFYGCGITEAFFSKLSSCEYGVFYGCRSLRTVDLPQMSFVPGSMFYGCAALESVNMPSAKYVSVYAFGYCSGMTNIELPACSSIQSSAFWNCSALKRASFPALSGSIYSHAFLNCTNLTELILTTTAKVPTLATNALSSTGIDTSDALGNYGSIYVADTMVSAFKSATNWSKYADRITSIENLPTA